ncbi:hypothetical protein N9L19_00665 [bacterium]|nr:hypothetical protein [bacterium]
MLALPLIGHQSAQIATPTGARREMTEVRLQLVTDHTKPVNGESNASAGRRTISAKRPRSVSNIQYPHKRQHTLDAAPAEQVEVQASPKPGLHSDVRNDEKKEMEVDDIVEEFCCLAVHGNAEASLHFVAKRELGTRSAAPPRRRAAGRWTKGRTNFTSRSAISGRT